MTASQTTEHAALRHAVQEAQAAALGYRPASYTVACARRAKTLNNRWERAARELAVYEYTVLGWSADRAGRAFLPREILAPADL